jgi:3-isopropylmalate/(R)-2-methylmalate dehydratase small subunit
MSEIVQVTGRAMSLRGDDIDTDRIMPARFLRAITFDGLEQHVFEDDRKAAAHSFDDPRYQGASILIVNANFGCGSSREHAPQGLLRWGIKALIGESFAEIFFGNSAIIGLPCVTAAAQDVRKLQDVAEKHPQSSFHIDLVEGTCEADGVVYAVALSPKIRDAFITGAWDTTGMLLANYQQVDAASARLPYIGGFAAV